MIKVRNYKKFPISPEIACEVLLPMLDEAAEEYRTARRARDKAFDALEAAEQNVKRLANDLIAEMTR